jgi:ketosteroid isomerase-like protein
VTSWFVIGPVRQQNSESLESPPPPRFIVRRRFLVCLLTLALPGVALAQQGDAEVIRALRAESNAAISRHDVAGIVALLDEEFHVTAGSGAMIDGAEAMGVAFAQRVEVGTPPEAAAEVGEWVGTWVTPSGPVRTGGHYSAYWRKRGDSWVIRSELFVTLYCEGSGCS